MVLTGPSDGQPSQRRQPMTNHDIWAPVPHFLWDDQLELPVEGIRIGGVDSDSQQQHWQGHGSASLGPGDFCPNKKTLGRD
jgi:hypothetical protein